MPKKVRELKAMLKKAGFTSRPGKGSHTVWSNTAAPDEIVTMCGQDGSDAPPYLEKRVKKAIRRAGGRS